MISENLTKWYAVGDSHERYGWNYDLVYSGCTAPDDSGRRICAMYLQRAFDKIDREDPKVQR